MPVRPLIASMVLSFLSVSALAQEPATVHGIYAEYLSGSQWVPASNALNNNLPFPSRQAGQTGLASGSTIIIGNVGSHTYRVYAVEAGGNPPVTMDIGDIIFDTRKMCSQRCSWAKA